MTNKEIERKYLVDRHNIPGDLDSYAYHDIEQAYLNTQPVVRVRKSDEEYFLTYKSKGFMERDEYNLPLDEKSYYHLLKKADGNIITKRRYLIPYGKYTIELDVFDGAFEGMVLAEVEFESLEEANAFTAPEWFIDDVTFSTKYHNSTLSKINL